MKLIYQLIPIFVLMIFLNSCSKDNGLLGGCALGFNYYLEISDELEAFSNASTAFAENPSVENCQAYKTAYLDYLDAMESVYDCASLAGQGEDLDKEIAEAKSEINAEDCQ